MTNLRDTMIQTMTVRNYSPKTIDLYLWAVRGLAYHYMKPPDQLSPKQVQDYLYYAIQTRNWSWSTVTTVVYGLKYFYYQILGQPPRQFYLPVPKAAKKLPVIWSPQEIKCLIREARNPQLKMMIMIAYASGLRRAEVVRLAVGDIDSKHMVLWVRGGKGKRDRGALLTRTLLNELRRYWLIQRPPVWLFPRSDGSPRPPKYFGQQFHEIKNRVAPSKECGPHSLRHSFATHQYASGADIYTVQKLLGHKSLSSTIVYIHLAQSILLGRSESLDLLKTEKILC